MLLKLVLQVIIVQPQQPYIKCILVKLDHITISLVFRLLLNASHVTTENIVVREVSQLQMETAEMEEYVQQAQKHLKVLNHAQLIITVKQVLSTHVQLVLIILLEV